MIKEKPATMIDGVATSQMIDTTAESLDVDNIDITSLVNGSGTINYEHKSDLPSQILGKITFAKKIFEEEDCDNERELYYWSKVKAPFLYIQAELFDADGHYQAAEAAAILRYDQRKREEGEKMPNVLSFSVEGSVLNKEAEGGVKKITHSIARKVTLTVQPANKTCAAEIMPPQDTSKKDDPLAFLKSEPKYIALTSTNKPIMKNLPAAYYRDFGKSEHEEAAEAHKALAGYMKGAVARYHLRKHEEHLNAANTLSKADAAPSTLVNNAALEKENIKKTATKLFEKTKNGEKLAEFISKKHGLSKAEGVAMAKMLAYRIAKRTKA